MEEQTTIRTRILIADIDAVLCVLARRTLEQSGATVTIAYDGADLIARFTPDQIDVVIVGMSLPRLNGLTVLREIKKRSPNTPVILLSDQKSIENAKQGVREGAFEYFATPIEDYGPLAFAVTRAIEAHQMRRQLDTLRQNQTESTESRALTAGAPPSRLLRELIEASRVKPLSETLTLLTETCANLMTAPQAIVFLPELNIGMQAHSAYGYANLPVAVQDFAERMGIGFVQQVVSARKTLIRPFPKRDGEATWQCIGTPMVASDQVIGVIVVYPLPDQPVSAARLTWLESLAAQGVLAVELCRLQEENEHLISNDPVTGVLKREVFLNLADREFRRSWRYNQPITAVVIDVRTEATLSAQSIPEMSSPVMRQAANICRNTVRSIDLLGRYDQNIFVILLLMTGRDGAKIVAERLHAGFNTLPPAESGADSSITTTLGIATYPRDGCVSIFDLLAVAQETQRHAQRNGTNQIAYA